MQLKRFITMSIVMFHILSIGIFAAVLDPSFNQDGIMTLMTGDRSVSINQVLESSDGKIFAVGDSGWNAAIFRLKKNGVLDTSFAGGDGLLTFTGQYTDGAAAAGWSSPNEENLYVTGSNGTGFYLARFKRSGRFDSSFDGDGIVTSQFLHHANSLVTSAGRTVVVGSNDSALGLMAFRNDGTLDPTFGNLGWVSTQLRNVETGSHIKQDTLGRYMVAGSTANDRGFLARFTQDGKLDEEFYPPYGILVLPDSSGVVRQELNSISIKANGAAVISGGNLRQNGEWDFLTAQVTTRGYLDTAFDYDGIQTTSIFSGASRTAGSKSVTLQENGKIISSGHGRHAFVSIRLNPNGALDTSFSTDGIATFAVDSWENQGANDGIWLREGGYLMAGVSGDNGAVVKVRMDDLPQPNTPPEWIINPLMLGTILVDVALGMNLTEYVVDPDPGDVLKFKKIAGPSWLQLAENGILFGIPTVFDIGEFSATFSVTDGHHNAVEVVAYGKVTKEHTTPSWVADAFVFHDGFVAKKYMRELEPLVVERAVRKRLVFEKIIGPAWASVSTDGKFFGVPNMEDLGKNKWVVKVSDSQTGFYDVAIIRLQVRKSPSDGIN